ncbi:MAG: hypothetical protein AAB354_00890 [candidate division KSB1 bacterium]
MNAHKEQFFISTSRIETNCMEEVMDNWPYTPDDDDDESSASEMGSTDMPITDMDADPFASSMSEEIEPSMPVAAPVSVPAKPKAAAKKASSAKKAAPKKKAAAKKPASKKVVAKKVVKKKAVAKKAAKKKAVKKAAKKPAKKKVAAKKGGKKGKR